MLLILTIISLFSTIYCNCNVENCNNNGTFYYFAYGSNLLAKRIHIKNPTAVFYSPAKLENHRLDFITYSKLWTGNAATIIEDKGEVVWGALWTISVNQMAYLDEQENVHTNMYFAKNVTVIKPDGTKVLARTYQETEVPTKINKGDNVPMNRRPSSTYLEVIALGAIESRLPAEYIAFIFSFPTNGQLASKEARDQLGYPF